ncbi:MAG: N-acetylmuramoyl-L-alanine amidase, partial [Actinobacteria bacterium]|nr:N-acetylmuramoyl-L-alanine amidase [Actinomycetota bacterium]
MRLFRGKKRKEKERPGEVGADGVEDSGGESPDESGPGEEETPAVATVDGEQPPVVPEEGEKPDFFDMSPEEAVSYRPPGVVVAVSKPRDFKPVLKAIGVIAVLGVAVLGVVLLWPSSEARVPDLIGKTLTEAFDAARAAGFQPAVDGWEYSGEQSDGVVLSQKPNGDKVVKKGSAISLTVSKGLKPGTGGSPGRESAPVTEQDGDGESAELVANPYEGKTVCVDPGHQVALAEKEWTDPGMSRKNPGDDGARGVATGNPEYLVTIDIGLKLKSLLEKDGIEVVMTRESNDVDLSNINRAEMANNAGADLYVRVHCGNSSDTGKSGTATLFPASTEWTESIFEAGKTAALFIQEELVKSCSTNDLGVFGLHDKSGFNWSRVPV